MPKTEINDADHKQLVKQINVKAKRKIKNKQQDHLGVWSGLGMFGLIGWSVTVPMLAGAALGVYLDRTYPQSFSWTLSALIVGLLVGCLLAWQWMDEEHKTINEDEND